MPDQRVPVTHATVAPKLIAVSLGSNSSNGLQLILTAMPDSSGVAAPWGKLTIDQVTFTGASKPGTRRLYELTSGFVMAHMPRACVRSPPI